MLRHKGPKREPASRFPYAAKTLHKKLEVGQWYYHRLRSMSSVEVAHRVREQGRRWRSRWRQYDWGSFANVECAFDGTRDLIPRLALEGAPPSLLNKWSDTA